VKNQGNKLMTFRAFSIGFSAAVLALACGGGDSNNDTDNGGQPVVQNPAPAPTDIRPTETCDDNPLLAGCPATAPGPTAAPRPAPTSDGDSAAELAKAAAENVLASNCGQCHGPALTPQQAQAGMNYIDDIDKLVDTGKIVPLNSAGSRIVQRMVRGEMPPVTTGKTVTEADINTVAQYIDNPRFWPEATPTGGNCLDDGQLVDFDDLYQDINRDLAGEDNDDTQFFRYISLTNRFTAGQCAEALEKDRQGLSKMMNMLSINASIESPLPVNTEETLFRIDLRDFDWDRAISVEGNNFDDVWEAIAANNPYAVEFVGDDADDAKDDTATAFPIMFADQMMDVAVIGNLYYAIIDVDVNQPLADFISNELQIDVVANLEDEESVRAGTTKSRISRQDRLVQRDDIEVRGGALWQSFDFEDNGLANDSIFEDPFGFAAGGTEAIFTLPNGMLGFIIADENDVIVEDSDILLDTNQNNFRAITSVSCSNCHAGGLIPVVDEVREVALSNAREIELDRDEVEQLEGIYVSPTEFARIVQEDSQGFYQRALQLADLPTQGGDPVSNVFLRFDQDVRLEDAAGDLGLTPDDLADNLDLLDPVLSVLDRGSLDRDDFTALYVDSLCQLSTPLENQPDEAVCDAAAAALGN
jgi:mono/diheme cytochrome c family protein